MKTLLLIGFSILVSSPALSQQALPKEVPTPADNPLTEEKILLGKMLYFDPRLSKDGSISCNSCHNVMAGGDDNRALSSGVAGKFGSRSSPTVWNSAFLSVQFWDGRAATLEEQAMGPLMNPVEMAMDSHKVIADRVQKIPGYRPLFDKAFGKSSKINVDTITKAIASYERTLITPNSRFDKYIEGDSKALTTREIRGFETMKTVGCFSCHSGPNFAGPQLPLGIGFYQKFPVFPGSLYDSKHKITEDKGRFEATNDESDLNMWRVPTLRNIALTAPYLHNGSAKTLDEVVRVMAKTQLNKDLKNSEVKDIVEFLKALTGELPRQSAPVLPPTEGISLVD